MSTFADALPPRAFWPAADCTTGMLKTTASAINKKCLLYFIEFYLCGSFGVSGEEREDIIAPYNEDIIAPYNIDDGRCIVYA